MEAKRLESLKQIAAGIAAQFGDKCEVVIHDVASSHPEHTIVHIENGTCPAGRSATVHPGSSWSSWSIRTSSPRTICAT